MGDLVDLYNMDPIDKALAAWRALQVFLTREHIIEGIDRIDRWEDERKGFRDPVPPVDELEEPSAPDPFELEEPEPPPGFDP